MVKFLILLFLLFFPMTPSGDANPFGCKLQQAQGADGEIITKQIRFKGYALIGTQRYGLIQIGETDFEVVEGDTIEGYHIIKITNTALQYLIGDLKQNLLLDFE